MPPRRRQRHLREQSELLISLNVRVPRELHRRVRLVCVEQDREMQEFVAEAIREDLAARAARRRT